MRMYELAKKYVEASGIDKGQYADYAEEDFIAGYKIAIKPVLEYCRYNIEYMWAANIVAKVLGCDSKNAKEELEKYFMEEK